MATATPTIINGVKIFSLENPKERIAIISESSLNLFKAYIAEKIAAKGAAKGIKVTATWPISFKISITSISFRTTRRTILNNSKVSKKLTKNITLVTNGGIKLAAKYLDAIFI